MPCPWRAPARCDPAIPGGGRAHLAHGWIDRDWVWLWYVTLDRLAGRMVYGYNLQLHFAGLCFFRLCRTRLRDLPCAAGSPARPGGGHSLRINQEIIMHIRNFFFGLLLFSAVCA